jgi:hypothetical protein
LYCSKKKSGGESERNNGLSRHISSSILSHDLVLDLVFPIMNSAIRRTKHIVCGRGTSQTSSFVFRCLANAAPSSEAATSTATAKKLPPPAVDQLRVVALRAAIPVRLQYGLENFAYYDDLILMSTNMLFGTS